MILNKPRRTFTFRASETELEAWRAAAETAGKDSIGQWLRDVANAEAKRIAKTK